MLIRVRPVSLLDLLCRMTFRHAAQKKVRETKSPMGSHHEHLAIQLPRHSRYAWTRRAFPNVYLRIWNGS